MSRKSVRLSDIAREAGVSTVTVSNALAGRKGVSDAMRSTIIETAKKCGYDMSHYEKKEQPQETIGILVSNRYIRIGTSFYWEMYQKVAFCLSRYGLYSALEILTEEEEFAAKPQLPRCLDSGRADYLIIIGRIEKSYLDRVMQKAGERVILLDFHDPDYPCSAVLSNNLIGMYRSVQYLVDRGHQKIGFIGTPQVSRNIRDRFYGYMKCLDDNGLELHPEWILEDRCAQDEKQTGIVLPDQLPTAFACSSDYGAAILADALEKRGLRIPEDISLTSYDDYLYGDSLGKKLTTYHVDMDKMAEQTVRELMQNRQPLHGFRVQYVDSVLVERGSVAPPSDENREPA